jgi:VWFA-related protein
VFAEASGVLGTMEALLVQLGGVEGRKALVLISPGFPQLRDLDRKLERVATLAREAATAVYFLDAAGTDGLLPEGGQRLGSAYDRIWTRSGGAQDLAEVTGGFALHFANSLVPGLERIGGEMRTYYVVGYVPSRPDDGKFRSVKVDVKVAGLKARTKKGYLAGGRR